MHKNTDNHEPLASLYKREYNKTNWILGKKGSSMGYLMGIDLGTSSAKAMIMDEEGECRALAFRDYDIQFPKAGYAEQDARMLWQAAAESIQAVMAQGEIRGDEISAIGLAGQMHGLVTLDREKNPIRPVIIWADKRSERQVRKLRGTTAEENACNPASAGFWLPSLMWMREEEPEFFDRICHILLPKDYIRYCLTGIIGTDYSDASGTLMFRMQKGIWDWENIEKYRIPREVLPSCEKSVKIIGTVTEEAGRLTGLAKGTPVICGGRGRPDAACRQRSDQTRPACDEHRYGQSDRLYQRPVISGL